MKYINVALLIAWLCIIFSFSSDTGQTSQVKSNHFIERVTEVVSKITHHSYSEEDIENLIRKLSYIVRKLAHFIEYLILGILVINVLKDYKPLDRNVLVILFVFCVLYACTDEFHQLFVSERAGRVIDVVIDSLGSLAGIYLYYRIYRKRHNRLVAKEKDF